MHVLVYKCVYLYGWVNWELNDGISYDIYTSLPECGGKMHLREGEFSRAHTDFFEAFKNYDESGSPRYMYVYTCKNRNSSLPQCNRL